MALSNRQQKVIPALIACDTVEEAARQSGVARTTIYAWLEKEEFSKAIATERRRLLDRAMRKMLNISMKAVLTLEKLLEAESEAVRIGKENIQMRGNILRRLAILEKEKSACTIPEKDRIIVITYVNGDQAEYDRKLQERLEQLRGRYGNDIKEDDFLVIGVKKFYRKKTVGTEV